MQFGTRVTAFVILCLLQNVNCQAKAEEKDEELGGCIYRDGSTMSPKIFNLWAGYGCYKFVPIEKRYNSKVITNTMDCYESSTRYPCFFSDTHPGELNFNYKDAAMSEIIEATFISRIYFDKWLNCVKEAEECCLNTMSKQNNHKSDSEHCPAVWDAWSCFNKTKLNTTVQISCPEIAYTGDPGCQKYASKQCQANGQWTLQTDYSTCANLDGFKQRYMYQITALIISVCVSIPSVIIFSLFYRLQVTRVRLHKNLLIAIIIRDIIQILVIYFVYFDELDPKAETSVLEENGILCRLLYSGFELATNWLFASMVLDGFYMYQLIVRTFDDNPPIIYYGVGLAVTCLGVSGFWAWAMIVSSDENCWIYAKNHASWINNGFRFIMISYNLCLLIGILKMLMKKLRSHATVHHIRKASRATFILVPLFGFQYFLTCIDFRFTTCLYESFIFYISATVGALQGLTVSLLFCYLNREVQQLLMSSLQEFRIKFNIFNRSRPKARQNSSDTTQKFNKSDTTEGSLVTMGSNQTIPQKLKSNPCLVKGCSCQSQDQVLDRFIQRK